MLKVIAIGNKLRADDGASLLVLDRLQNFENIKCIDVGSDAFIVLEHLLEEDPLIIIDCANMGIQPGEFLEFSEEDVHLKMADKFISLHGFSLAETINLAKNTGKVTDFKIIGIEPKSLIFGEPVSPEVLEVVPKITQFILEEAKKYEQENIDNR
jgi:hydrogenase maturation protease